MSLCTALLVPASSPASEAAAESARRCMGADRGPNQATIHFLRASMLCLVNRVRDHYRLRSLQFNPELRSSATGHSNDMVADDYFSHFGPQGSTPSGRLARSGYLARVANFRIGENIGGGVGRLGSPLTVFRAWMHSPPHRANILDRDFREFGVGVARGFPLGRSSDAATYTLDLGSRP